LRNEFDDYLINRFYDGPDRLKLLPTHGDREVYRHLILERTLSTTPSRVAAAYEYFRQSLKESHDSEPIDPLRLLETIEQSLQVVMINLGDADDPYLIFESLNAKGEPLTQADLVRNYVLMQFRNSLEPGGEQERIYKSYWRPLQDSLGSGLTDFLRHYCMKDGSAVEKRTVYTAIKKLLAQASDGAALEAELKDMARLGGYYARFIDPSREDDAAVRSRLAAFVEMDVTTGYPLLLRLFDSRSRQTVSHSDFKACLHLIESFVVRRAICAVPTNSLGKMFMQWSKDYRETDVVGWLTARIAAGSGNARWPNDNAFQSAFETSNQYGRKATRHVLASLERSFAHKEPADLTGLTIEHVMPQELSAEWREMLGPGYSDVHADLLHTFGNLTLTGYNPELGNLSFDQKRQKLLNSRIQLNRWICDQQQWNEITIETRSAALADAAKKLWLGPETLTEETAAQYASQPKDPNAPKTHGASVTPSEKLPRPGSKGERIIGLMCRVQGATIEEIAEILGHEPHTALTRKDPTATSRGYLSGLRQRYAQHFDFTSENDKDGVRFYKASKR
jgi:hypothetical protein